MSEHVRVEDLSTRSSTISCIVYSVSKGKEKELRMLSIDRVGELKRKHPFRDRATGSYKTLAFTPYDRVRLNLGHGFSKVRLLGIEPLNAHGKT